MNKEKPQPVETEITQEDWQEHLIRAWWQPKESIIIPKATEQEVYVQSKILSEKYHPSIPLVQKTTIRFRLMQVAGAVSSMMCFLKNGKLYIPPQAIIVASRVLQGLYDMPACSYDRYSSSERAKSKVTNKKEVLQKVFQREKKKGNLAKAVDTLLDMQEMTTDDLHKIFDYLEGDTTAATLCFRTLYKNNCLERKGQTRFYQPTQAFIKLLLGLRKTLTNNKGFEGGIFR